MPVILKINLTGGPGLIDALQRKGPRIVQVLTSKLNALLFTLQSYIVSEKLSGQMLKRGTGALSASVRIIPAEFNATNIIGGIESSGGPAFYGKFFEIESAGGTGGTKAHTIMAVKARALRFVMGGEVYFRKSVLHPGFAARPFMTSSLAENAEAIKSELQAALDKEILEP
jgi:hypothetical protein